MVVAETKMAKGMNRAGGHVSFTFLHEHTPKASVKHSLRSLVKRIP
jgi:hypothetical protein